jgi:predicted sugar kinase
MHIELVSPACFFLGCAPFEGQLCQLGIALQHPPIQLLARPAPQLSVTGGRADLAARQATGFYGHYSADLKGERAYAEIEIELAIPSLMGLGSEGMLGLSVGHALARLHGLPEADLVAMAQAVGLGQEAVLEAQAFTRGGLLAVDQGGSLQKHLSIVHSRQDDDWVFVLVLPRPPAGAADTFEAERRRELERLVGRSQQVERAAGRLWAAAERGDIAAFGSALMELGELNWAALAQASQDINLSAGESAILDEMRAGGAVAWGRATAGFGLYGLVKGADASRDLRRALAQRLGFFGGTVMATICDNQGARCVVRNA